MYWCSARLISFFKIESIVFRVDLSASFEPGSLFSPAPVVFLVSVSVFLQYLFLLCFPVLIQLVLTLMIFHPWSSSIQVLDAVVLFSRGSVSGYPLVRLCFLFLHDFPFVQDLPPTITVERTSFNIHFIRLQHPITFQPW